MQIKHRVVAQVYDEKGNLIDEREGHNTVLTGVPTTDATQEYNGYVMILQRLLNDDDSGLIISDELSALTQMELGTGTPDNEGLGTPYTPTNTQENFDSITWDYTTSTSSIDALLTTTWDATYPALSGVTEAAILNANDDPFASKTFSPALSKTTGGSIVINWTLTVSA
jgi:hypothetical protein